MKAGRHMAEIKTGIFKKKVPVVKSDQMGGTP